MNVNLYLCSLTKSGRLFFPRCRDIGGENGFSCLDWRGNKSYLSNQESFLLLGEEIPDWNLFVLIV